LREKVWLSLNMNMFRQLRAEVEENPSPFWLYARPFPPVRRQPDGRLDGRQPTHPIHSLPRAT
jgi:hypothetical protein